MIPRLVTALLVLGLVTTASAAARKDPPQISMVAPSSGKSTVNRDQLVLLVIEGPFLSHEQKPVADAGVVEFVNGLLKAKGGSYLGVYIREGVKYGDVVRALDTLSLTEAKNIGVSLMELPAGREP